VGFSVSVGSGLRVGVMTWRVLVGPGVALGSAVGVSSGTWVSVVIGIGVEVRSSSSRLVLCGEGVFPDETGRTQPDSQRAASSKTNKLASLREGVFMFRISLEG
jgi:hypothetical protein